MGSGCETCLAGRLSRRMCTRCPVFGVRGGPDRSGGLPRGRCRPYAPAPAPRASVAMLMRRAPSGAMLPARPGDAGVIKLILDRHREARHGVGP